MDVHLSVGLGTILSAVFSGVTVVGLVWLIVKGAQWTQRVEDALTATMGIAKDAHRKFDSHMAAFHTPGQGD